MFEVCRLKDLRSLLLDEMLPVALPVVSAASLPRGDRSIHSVLDVCNLESPRMSCLASSSRRGCSPRIEETGLRPSAAALSVRDLERAFLAGDWFLSCCWSGAALTGITRAVDPSVSRVHCGGEARGFCPRLDCWQAQQHVGQFLEKHSLIQGSLQSDLRVRLPYLSLEEAHSNSRDIAPRFPVHLEWPWL